MAVFWLLMALFVILCFAWKWILKANSQLLMEGLFGALIARAVRDLAGKGYGLVGQLFAAVCMVIQRIIDRDPVVLDAMAQWIQIILLVPATHASVKWFNAQNVPCYISSWLPAAILYPMALWNWRRAAGLGVAVECIAGLTTPGRSWYTWIIAGLTGPMLIAFLSKRWGIDQRSPGEHALKIRLIFLITAAMTALTGVTCDVVFGQILSDLAEHQPVHLIWLRWFCSDTVASQLLGLILFDIHRTLRIQTSE